MRIGLFTDTYYPETNGVATSVYQLKKELELLGHDVYVFTVSNPNQKEAETHVYRMPSIPFILLKERRVSCAFAKKWYRKIQALHLDVIHTQTEFLVGHMGRKAAEKFHIPLVHTYHTLYEDYTHYLRIPGNERFKGVVRIWSRICLNWADRIVVPTEKVRNIVQGYGVNKEITVQPTGIRLGKFGMVDWNEVTVLKQKYGIQPGQHVLISIGRLSQEKNIAELLHFLKEAVEIDPEVRFIIVGDGPERMNLEQIVQEDALERYVVFTGEVPWNRIQNYYALGDVFVSASVSETQGLTYAEALASGKPLLVRKDDCLQGLLQEGINGYAYEDRTGFLEGYRKLFAPQDALDEKTVRESVQKLSSKAFGEHIESIYRDVIAQYREKQTEGYERCMKMNACVEMEVNAS